MDLVLCQQHLRHGSQRYAKQIVTVIACPRFLALAAAHFASLSMVMGLWGKQSLILRKRKGGVSRAPLARPKNHTQAVHSLRPGPRSSARGVRGCETKKNIQIMEALEIFQEGNMESSRGTILGTGSSASGAGAGEFASKVTL